MSEVTLRRGLAVVLVPFAAVMDFTPLPANAQDGGSVFTINHINVYRESNLEPKNISILLRDQFGESNHTATGLEWFGVPVDKNQEGVPDPRAHLSRWKASPQACR